MDAIGLPPYCFVFIEDGNIEAMIPRDWVVAGADIAGNDNIASQY
jgi:hypothetical protein